MNFKAVRRLRKLEYLCLQKSFKKVIKGPIFFQDIPAEIEILPVDRTALEGLAYLAYETVGQLVDICLQVRHDETTSDPILRQMVGKA